jgi:hypothetical protein
MTLCPALSSSITTLWIKRLLFFECQIFKWYFIHPFHHTYEWRWDEMLRRVWTINAKTTQVNLVFNARLDENRRQQKNSTEKCASVRAFFVFEEISLNKKKKSWCVSVIMHHALVDAFETGGKPKCHKKVCDFNGPALSRWMEPLLWFYGWNAPENLFASFMTDAFANIIHEKEENAEKNHH